MSYGKWIGGSLGWAFGGPIGGLVGFALGALMDGMRGGEASETRYIPPPRQQATTAGDLELSLIVLIAAMMKADGAVTRAELDHVRRFLLQQFGEARAQQLLLVLRDVLKREVPVHEVCRQIRQHMPHPARLQLMHYLIGLAHADGEVHATERRMLEQVAAGLGIRESVLASMHAMFRRPSSSTAYQILELEPTATDEEVKKAYRRMAIKYHPDKVAQLGEEVQKAAAEKFRKVQEAYERIREQRGMK
ncbi:MAG: TerB family tellurite resistance protein [Flavobacteriales bacterium]|nr:TerB family tellurite resistance protein [Flavobacteriales bacterium]